MAGKVPFPKSNRAIDDSMALRYRSGHRKRWLKKSKEWDAGDERVIRQLDKIWTKYSDKPAPNALGDPAIDEKRVLFTCEVDRIATFGKP